MFLIAKMSQTLIVRPGKPFRRNAANPLAAGYVDFVAAARVVPAIDRGCSDPSWVNLRERPAGSLFFDLQTRHGESRRTLIP